MGGERLDTIAQAVKIIGHNRSFEMVVHASLHWLGWAGRRRPCIIRSSSPESSGDRRGLQHMAQEQSLRWLAHFAASM